MEQVIKNIKVIKSTQEEKKLETLQKPYLEKLEQLGYGLHIEKKFIMPLPIYFKQDNFPVDLYNCIKKSKHKFNTWNELVDYINSLN